MAWPGVFSVIIGKNLHSRIPEQPRLLFRFERKISTFRDKQKQKQFSTTEILEVIRGIPHFKVYCKATVIKIYGTDTKIDTQINGTEQRVQK